MMVTEQQAAQLLDEFMSQGRSHFFSPWDHLCKTARVG